MGKFDYDKAEADLYDAGDRYSEDIYSYRDSKYRDSYLREHGLNPEKYYKPDSPSSSSSSSDCFVTTACVQAKGLPDDCEELETLRNFRDNYLFSVENGRKAVVAYYRAAPIIVDKINARPDAGQIWDGLYNDLVLPCVKMIKAGEYEEAYKLYKDTTLSLAEKYASE